ncbi:MAG: diguanylate cyclase, partial [Pseudorhodobacter sp.]|nr:diguanylate cyclase [Pseudorhodobacter sp.]
FLIALPATTGEEASIVARRLCSAVESQAAILPDGTRIPVTISFGMSVGGSVAQDGMVGNVADLVDKADRALMQSKSGGRNMVTILNHAA